MTPSPSRMSRTSHPRNGTRRTRLPKRHVLVVSIDAALTVVQTFIFVRPPPSKSNHPLNLQVQMVPPRVPPGNGSSFTRQSVDGLATPIADTPRPGDTVTPRQGSFAEYDNQSLNLTRTISNRSDTSAAYSGSSTSVASFSSVASNASTRRTIIPLYNLQAHNVMTNIIVDAGTDAKIAKFNKRGMELIGLAILEPVEVWGPTPVALVPPRSDTLLSPGMDNSPFLRTKRLSSPSRPITPDMPHTPASSSALSLSSVSYFQGPHSPTGHTQLQPPPNLPPAETHPPASRKPQLFGKFFKKKDTPEVSAALPTPMAHDRAPSAPGVASRVTRHFKRSSLLGSSSTTPTGSILQAPENQHTPILFPSSRPSISEPAPAPAASPSTSAFFRPPVLGIQPTMRSPVVPPVGRPALYVWIVHRWLKSADTGILGGVIGRIGASAAHAAGKMSSVAGGASATAGSSGYGNGTGAGTGVEVRFEWKRGRGVKKRGKRRGGGGNSPGAGGDDLSGGAQSTNATNSPRGSPAREVSGGGGGSGFRSGSGRKRENRVSVASFSASVVSEDGASLRCRRAGARNGDEEGDDGEDSDPEDSETPWTCTLKIRRLGDQEVQMVRVKVGTLSQTPHHPKLVAMLKVPFPLPDVEVDKLMVRKRQGPGGGPGGSGEGLMLTAEEIKDVVSSTGLWLAVREGFGGIGKVSRKGDGWRIRA